MRVTELGGRLPDDIPVAGVTLAELMGDVVEYDVFVEKYRDNTNVVDRLEMSDEIRCFKSPAWTWKNLGGIAGYVVLRGGRAMFWVITRMN